MIDKTLLQDEQKKQSTVANTALTAKRRSTFAPARFSVSRLRKHRGIQKDRNPVVI